MTLRVVRSLKRGFSHHRHSREEYIHNRSLKWCDWQVVVSSTELEETAMLVVTSRKKNKTEKPIFRIVFTPREVVLIRFGCRRKKRLKCVWLDNI